MQEKTFTIENNRAEVEYLPKRITRKMRRGLPKRGNNRKTTKGRKIQYIKLANGRTEKIIHERFDK